MIIPKEVTSFVNENWKYIAAIIVLLILWKVVLPKIKRRLDIERELGNVRDGKFNPIPYADGLHSEINDWWGDIEPFEQFNALTDEQKRAVAEAFNRRHGLKGATIRIALQEASYPFSPYVREARDKAVTSLTALGY